MKKEKLFRLKKDIIHPDHEVKAGKVKTAKEWNDLRDYVGYPYFSHYINAYYILKHYPDWFEEVEEEKAEFTKEDMIDFALFSRRKNGGYLMEAELKRWLEQNKK